MHSKWHPPLLYESCYHCECCHGNLSQEMTVIFSRASRTHTQSSSMMHASLLPMTQHNALLALYVEHEDKHTDNKAFCVLGLAWSAASTCQVPRRRWQVHSSCHQIPARLPPSLGPCKDLLCPQRSLEHWQGHEGRKHNRSLIPCTQGVLAG